MAFPHTSKLRLFLVINVCGRDIPQIDTFRQRKTTLSPSKRYSGWRQELLMTQQADTRNQVDAIGTALGLATGAVSPKAHELSNHDLAIGKHSDWQQDLKLTRQAHSSMGLVHHRTNEPRHRLHSDPRRSNSIHRCASGSTHCGDKTCRRHDMRIITTKVSQLHSWWRQRLKRIIDTSLPPVTLHSVWSH